MRRALIDALAGHGIRTLNPGLVRTGFALWWRDRSAADLGRGRHARTRPVLRTPSLNALDHARILPGDLAVTADGTHVLAYLGDHVRIEADPGLKVGDQVVRQQVECLVLSCRPTSSAGGCWIGPETRQAEMRAGLKAGRRVSHSCSRSCLASRMASHSTRTRARTGTSQVLRMAGPGRGRPAWTRILRVW